MPDRVAVRLPNWLGDTVMAVPALRAMRDAWRGARMLAAGPWARVLAGQDLADTLVSYPRAWSARIRAARAVREFAPDLAVLLPSSLESAVAARCWGAVRRVGFWDGGRALLLTDAAPRPSPRRHQVDEYLALVEHLGVDVRLREPALRRPGDDAETRGRARALLVEVGVPRGDRVTVVGVHLGAAYGSSKLWPVARVVELVRALADDGDAAVLLGPRDSGDLAKQVTAAVSVPSLVGRDEPELLPALLTEISVLVGGDTGVTHLAAALGTPVVALFGPTDPRLTAPRGHVAVVMHAVACAPCFYRTCPIDHPCMRDITAAEVMELVRTLTDARATP